MDERYPTTSTESDQPERGPLEGGTLWWLHQLLAQESLDATDTLLMVALAEHVSPDSDECWPSIARLAQRARCSYGTARRRLTSLEQRGWIVRSERARDDGGRSTDLYVLQRTPLLNLRGGLAHDDARGPRASERAVPPARPDARAEQTNVEQTKDPAELSLALGVQPAFAEWWALYPYRRGSRAAAERAWKAAVRHTPPHLILAGVRRFAADPNLPPKDEQQFVRHGSTWLRDRGWEDGPLPPRGRPRSAAPPQQALDVDRDDGGQWELVGGEWRLVG